MAVVTVLIARIGRPPIRHRPAVIAVIIADSLVIVRVGSGVVPVVMMLVLILIIIIATLMMLVPSLVPAVVVPGIWPRVVIRILIMARESPHR